MELKIGGKYRMRGGDTITIIRPYGDDNYPFLADSGECYTRWGKYITDEAEESSFDLIEEISTEPEFFVMDARATMAMHFMAQMRGDPKYAFMAACAVEAADALIAELTKGKME